MFNIKFNHLLLFIYYRYAYGHIIVVLVLKWLKNVPLFNIVWTDHDNIDVVSINHIVEWYFGEQSIKTHAKHKDQILFFFVLSFILFNLRF